MILKVLFGQNPFNKDLFEVVEGVEKKIYEGINRLYFIKKGKKVVVSVQQKNKKDLVEPDP